MTPRIVLVDRDPYVAFVVGLALPDAELVEVEPDADLEPHLAEPTDLVILDLEGPRARDVLLRKDRPPVVGLVDGSRTSRPDAAEGLTIVLRPILPAELQDAVRQALGVSAARTVARVARRRWWLGPACVAAVVVAVIAELASLPTTAPRVLLLGAVLAYAVARMRWRDAGKTGAWLDVTVAAFAVGWSGGLTSGFLAFAMLVSIEAGLVLGISVGAAAASVIALVSVPQAVEAVGAGRAGIQQLVAWLPLFGLTAACSGVIRRIERKQSHERDALLVEANRSLARLYDIARTMPEGLDRRAIAGAALRTVRAELGAPAGLLLLRESGMLFEIDSYGLPAGRLVIPDAVDPSELANGDPAVAALHELPPSLARRLAGHERWLIIPLRAPGANGGVLLAAAPPGPERRFDQLRRLAEQSAIALENASLFWRLGQLSADRERQRVAAELHDGVSQSLIHLRLELDFLAGDAKAPAQALRSEVGRLAGVTDRVLADVRSAVNGLNASPDGKGLVGSLTAYLRDVQGLAGPRIVFRPYGWPELSTEVERELFRIAQEAVSNAIRHAGAETVTVLLEGGPSGRRLVVEDDGVGIEPGSEAGLGLETMRRRAERIEAAFTTGPGPDGGTRVEVRLERDPGHVVISSGRRDAAR